MSLHAMFPQARNLLHETQNIVQELESSRDVGSASYYRASDNLERLQADVRAMESVVNQEGPARRETWRIKIRELDNECKFLRSTLDRYSNQANRAQREQQEREALFARRTDALPTIVIDGYKDENESINRSRAMVEEYTWLGRQVMGSLGDQRSRLKSAHRKVLDIANTLGLSNSLIRVIERTEWTDKVIVYGGMVVVTVVLVLVWYYF